MDINWGLANFFGANAIKCLEHIPEQPVFLEYSPLSDSILTQKQKRTFITIRLFQD